LTTIDVERDGVCVERPRRRGRQAERILQKSLDKAFTNPLYVIFDFVNRKFTANEEIMPTINQLVRRAQTRVKKKNKTPA
jgi:hypothetical protein